MPKKSIKPGQVFQLGDHVLGCGDARNRAFVQEIIGKPKINLVLCDPPYGVAYVESKQDFTDKSGRHRIIANDHTQTDSDYRHFTYEWLETIKPYLSRKNSVYIFNSDKMLFSLREGMQDAGIKFAQLLVWVKNHAVVGRMDYLPQHELIAYGWYGSHAFQKAKDKSVLVYPKPNKSRLHPTMKPVGLLRRLILNSSKVGDTVYDPFGGSGSTLLACEQTKRRCVMSELDPHYCAVIMDRFAKVTGKKPVRLH